MRTGWLNDIYLYVAGSSYIENVNNRNASAAQIQPVSMAQDSASIPMDGAQTNQSDMSHGEEVAQVFSFTRGQSKELGPFSFQFNDFIMVDSMNIPTGKGVGVRAQIDFVHLPSNTRYSLEPFLLFIMREGEFYGFFPSRNRSLRFIGAFHQIGS